MTDANLIFDRELIGRYDKQGPRYTSYPTAVQFTPDFGVADYLQHARQSNLGPAPAPLSLYFHLPFCATVCYYCACNKVVTRNSAHTLHYLHSLFLEIQRQGELFDRSRKVDQLHWGGGTPTFFSQEQMQELMDQTRAHFTLHEDDSGEYSIEIDPRTVTPERIGFLRKIGFNRISLGIQDFNPVVQKAVNRIQPEEQTREVMEAARLEGFRSISVDLIYGLPFQSVESFDETLARVIDAAPDRISIFNYAHLPQLFKTQRQIDESTLPEPETKLQILQNAIEHLTGAGYQYIGMDHFAKPDDELAVAQREGKLSRNFQGYATHGDCDIIGLGVSSISRIGHSYSQNEREIEDYERRIEVEGLAVFRGVGLSPDDVLRRAVINQIICHFELDWNAMEARFPLNLREYFAPEQQELAAMAADGLLQLDAAGFRVLPRGRLLIRNICMVFDHYLHQAEASQQRFSRVI
jgi:oxygen-independent coproporphyrinogen-3 oxidase